MKEPIVSNAYKSRLFILFFVFCAVLYLFFPSANHTGDAWAYAGGVKQGTELFSPHHLFYSATLFLLFHGMEKLLPLSDAMAFSTAFNGIVAWFSIYILFHILRINKVSKGKTLALLSIAAFSYGFWRFATENETYIFPIFFSLIATLFFAKFQKANSVYFALLSGIFAAIAALYHQSHIFWWLGLGIGFLILNRRQGLVYFSGAILIPLSYILVLHYYALQNIDFNNLREFVLTDVYKGAAGFAFKPHFLLMGVINFGRTFFQMHGMVFFLIKEQWLFALPVLLALVGMIYTLTVLIRKHDWKIQNKVFFYSCLLIFVLQWAFAVYNNGNAEFMAMLPALLCILLGSVKNVSLKMLYALGGSLFVWNFFLAILPMHIYKWNANSEIAEWTILHSDAYFIATEHALIENLIYYKTGSLPQNILKAPSSYKQYDKNTQPLKMQIDSLLQKGKIVYSDYGGKPALMDRGKILGYYDAEDITLHYKKRVVAKFHTKLGDYEIFELK